MIDSVPDYRAIHAPSTRVLGVRVDLVTPAGALDLMKTFVRDGRSHHVVTINPEFIMAARRNRDFRDVLNAADLALPDGIGAVWACRQHGHPLHQRVTGVDTVKALCAWGAKEGLRPFLLGAAPGVAERAATALCRDHPGLKIAGICAGSPAAEEEEQIVASIRDSRPDFLFVAFGAPQQDHWIDRTRERLHVPIAMGVGGTFDFLAGKRRRAPIWMQNVGIEWLYRLFQEPWRWKRMSVLPIFALQVILESRFGKRKGIA